MKRTALPRWLRRLLLGAAAAPLLLIAATQVALSTPLFLSAINAAFAGEVSFDYQSARSWWPGRVHVRGLRIQGEDSNVQWLLRVEQTDATISLRELLHRTFHATWSRSSGVSFVARMKLARAEATPERLYGLAPIAGFAPLPLKAEGPDELDTEARYHLWTVHLDDTVAEAREIWVQRLRLTGTALVTGGFFLKPVRRAQVEAQLLAGPLALSIAGVPVVTDLRGHLAASLHPFDPRQVHGIDVLGQVGLQARLTGELAGLAFLAPLLPPGIRAAAEPGPLAVDLRLEDGRLAPGSELALGSPRASLELWRLGAAGAAEVTLSVGEDRADLALELTRFSLAPIGASRQPMRAELVRLAATGDRPGLSGAVRWRSLAADLVGGEIPDLLLAQVLLPTHGPVQIEGGRASLDGHLVATPQASHGHLRFAAHDAALSAAGTRLRASLHGEALLRADGLRTLELSGSRLSIDRLALAGSGAAPGWWGRFRLARTRIDFPARALALQLTGDCRDARPLAPVLAAHGVPGFVQEMLSMEGVHLSGGVRAAPAELALVDLRADGAGAGLRVDWRARGAETRGSALVGAYGLTAGLDLDGGGASLVVLEPTAWYQQRLARQDRFERRDLLARSEPRR